MGIAQTSTPVNGIITSDSTWTQANSPYSLAGPVAVNQGVTLTIEPGTTVDLNSYYIQVNGTLTAIGTSSNPIYINNGSGYSIGEIYTPNFGITLTSLSNSWNEQTSSGSIIENAVFNSAQIGIYNSPKLANTNGANIFVLGSSPTISNNSNCVLNVYGGSPLILDNYVNEIDVTYGSPVISNNTIADKNGAYGIQLEGGIGTVTINDNIISGAFDEGCINGGGNATIVRNLLINNSPAGAAIKIGGPQTTFNIQNNTLVGYYGISGSGGIQSTLADNNFQNNSIYSIYWNTPNNLDATNNWWGTIDERVISTRIFDNKNNFNLGTVNFVPFLTAPNPQVPNENTPTSTPASSISSSPSIPEFPFVICLTIVVILSTIAISVYRDRLKHRDYIALWG